MNTQCGQRWGPWASVSPGPGPQMWLLLIMLTVTIISLHARHGSEVFMNSLIITAITSSHPCVIDEETEAQSA